jgi:DNA-binding NarL/FixJ family response regulator
MAQESNEFLEKINALTLDLNKYKEKLAKVQNELAQSNTALSAMAKIIEQIRFDTEEKIFKRISSEILPLLHKLKNENDPEKVQVQLERAIKRLNMFFPVSSNPYGTLMLLSPQEMRIASMIKDGYKNKEIASMLNLSLHTVKTHRRSIREKMHLKNTPIELSSYLENIFIKDG